MIVGMTLATFTLLHVLISLLAIVAGMAALLGWIAGRYDRWTTLFFLVTTALTSITGFMFPITRLTPGLVVGGISTVLLTLAFLALYRFRLTGPWRKTYVITATMSLYLNCFVGVAQAFDKVSVLKVSAPTATEAPFAAAQAAVLLLFIFLGYLAVGKSPAAAPSMRTA